MGFAEAGLTSGQIQMSSGTSLTVIMGEPSLLGLVSLEICIIALIGYLFCATAEEDEPCEAAIQYGILLFSIMWPVWLW